MAVDAHCSERFKGIHMFNIHYYIIFISNVIYYYYYYIQQTHKAKQGNHCYYIIYVMCTGETRAPAQLRLPLLLGLA
jgi:hypothetical protein